jgi:hypothetical protein
LLCLLLTACSGGDGTPGEPPPGSDPGAGGDPGDQTTPPPPAGEAPPPGTGSVTLSWLAPTERVDGSPIGQLAGYRILFGQISRAYDRDIRLDNPGLTRYVIEGLGSGTWYFAMTTITSDGLESAPSAEASKTFP